MKFTTQTNDNYKFRITNRGNIAIDICDNDGHYVETIITKSDKDFNLNTNFAKQWNDTMTYGEALIHFSLKGFNIIRRLYNENVSKNWYNSDGIFLETADYDYTDEYFVNFA